jgi:hypothetical protein
LSILPVEYRYAKTHLEDLFPILCSIYPSSYSENRRCLSSARWSIEEEMWQPVLFDELLNYTTRSINDASVIAAVDILVVVISL